MTKYNDLKFLTSHNAYAAPDYGYRLDNIFFTNQKYNITEQLKLGIRGFMLDIYWDENNNKLVCSHTNSSPSDVDLDRILTEIKNFVDNNPNEIITIFCEDYLSGNYTELASALSETGHWFRFNEFNVEENGWPTVTDMVENNQQIVFFLEKTTDKEDLNLPYLYDYAVETVYGDNSVNKNSWIKNREESEPLSGGSRKMSKEESLAIINHFRSVPQWGISDYEGNYNKASNLIDHIDNFYDNHYRTPNTIATDFVGIGGHSDALKHLKYLKPDFYTTDDTNYLINDDIDWDQEDSFRIPDEHKLVGVRVYNEPGYGLVDIAFCHAPADDLSKRKWGQPITGKHASGEGYECYSSEGQVIDCIEIAKHHQYGIVNMRLHSKEWHDWMTENEKRDAQVVRTGKGTENIWKIGIRSEGGHGMVDLKYMYREDVHQPA